jgi:hypothetical protein
VCFGGISLVTCQIEGCARQLHHMSQTMWESGDKRREAHGSKQLCGFHHPVLNHFYPPHAAQICQPAVPPIGQEPSINEFDSNSANLHGQGEPLVDDPDSNDGNVEWLLDTNRSVWQVYQQAITPNADGTYSLPSTTLIGDLVFDLAFLTTMGMGALTDAQLQKQRIDKFVRKGWLKKRSVNVTRAMFQKEILRCWDVWSMDDS